MSENGNLITFLLYSEIEHNVVCAGGTRAVRYGVQSLGIPVAWDVLAPSGANFPRSKVRLDVVLQTMIRCNV